MATCGWSRRGWRRNSVNTWEIKPSRTPSGCPGGREISSWTRKRWRAGRIGGGGKGMLPRPGWAALASTAGLQAPSSNFSARAGGSVAGEGKGNCFPVGSFFYLSVRCGASSQRKLENGLPNCGGRENHNKTPAYRASCAGSSSRTRPHPSRENIWGLKNKRFYDCFLLGAGRN